jgi:hypothetical protein
MKMTDADAMKAGGSEGLAALRHILAEEIDSEHLRSFCWTCERTSSATPSLALRLVAVQEELAEAAVVGPPPAEVVTLDEIGPMPEVRSVADGFAEGAEAGLVALRDLIATELAVAHVHGYCRTCKRTSSNTPSLAARLLDVHAAIDALPLPVGESFLAGLVERRTARRRAAGFPTEPSADVER